MSNFPPYLPKVDANTFGPASKGYTRNHVIPIEVMTKSDLIQAFLRLPNGGKEFFYFDLRSNNGQYLLRANNDLGSVASSTEILGGQTPDRGYHAAYTQMIAARVAALEANGSIYNALLTGVERWPGKTTQRDK